MLESLVSWILNNYIGEYFSLNTEHLSIALLQGQVDLENVPLRNTALRKFDIPVQVKCGIIGKLQLQIPITHIRSQPWILKITDMMVLLGPYTSMYDVEVVEQYQQQRMKKMMDELELQHKRHLLSQLGCEMAAQEEPNSWWGASLLSTISNNIQIILDNVHVKYESADFNFGIQIDSLKVQTTDSQWRPGFVEPLDGMNIFKKFDIQGFSIYWNPHPNQATLSGPTMAMTLEAFKRKLVENMRKDQNNSYIMQPFTVNMRVEKNTSRFPLRSVPHSPRFKVDIRSQKIELELNRQQIAQMEEFFENWVLFERARMHRKWRPISSVGDRPRHWWRFAIYRTFEQSRSQRPARSLQQTMTRLKLMNAYTRAYRRRLQRFLELQTKSQLAFADPHQSSPVTNTHEDTALIKQIEHDSQFTYEDLHSFREAVYQKLSHELKRRTELEESRQKQDDSPFEVLQGGSRQTVPVEEKVAPLNPGMAPTQTGWLQWMSTWLGGENAQENSGEEEDLNEAIYLNMKPPKLTKHALSPELDEVERRMEAEILQVLSESLDDSNILRRDNLLAELVVNFSSVLLRVSNENLETKLHSTAEPIEMLTFDLKNVSNRVQISPKQHRIEVSQSIGDLSVQLMQHEYANVTATGSDCSVSKKSSCETIAHNNDEFEDVMDVDSLSGLQNHFKTKLLLAIGCTYDNENMGKTRKRKSSEDTVGEVLSKNSRNSIATLFYKRAAPKQEIYHQFNVSCAPLTIIADENVTDGLRNIFSKNNKKHEPSFEPVPIRTETATTTPTITAATLKQIFASIFIPELIVELRSQKAAKQSLLSPRLNTTPFSSPRNGNASVQCEEEFTLDSAPFVRAQVQCLTFSTAQRGSLSLDKIHVDFEHFHLEDLFEKTPGGPLVKIGEIQGTMEENKNHHASCPDLLCSAMNRTDENHQKIPAIPTPNETTLPTIFSTSLPSTNVPMERRNSLKTDPNFAQHPQQPECNIGGFQKGGKHSIKITFIPAEHPEFSSVYEKANCKIDGTFAQTTVELGMNRRSWMLLLDFFGFCSAEQPTAAQSECNSSYLVNCELSAAMLNLHMNYPQNGTQLGVLSLERPKLKIQNDLNLLSNPLILALSAHSFLLTDQSPFYSEFYTDRVHVAPAQAQKLPSIHLNLLKYRNNEATHEFDLLMALEVNAPLKYIHTHRYFCSFLDFWFQLAELYDKVTVNNSRRNDTSIQQNPDCALKMRCQLNVELLDGAHIYIPQNQHSREALLVECTRVQANNSFCMASSMVQLLNQYLANQLHAALPDCLMDCTNIHIQSLALRHGTFARKQLDQQVYKTFTRRRDMKRVEFNGSVSFFTTQQQIIMDECSGNGGTNVSMDVYRNLSSLYSHNVPDLFVLLHLENMVLKCTTDAYKLFRGCMSQNFGELLLPQAHTFPMELLELPEANLDSIEKYSTFSLRVVFRKVQIHLYTPIFGKSAFEEFAKFQIRSAKMSFDIFVDSQSELDFICENASMEDARPDSTRKTPECFKKILKARSNKFYATRKESNQSDASSSTQFDDRKLLLESHIQMRKDEPPVYSLILVKTRVLLVMEWIEMLKAFIFLQPEAQKTAAFRSSSPFTRSHMILGHQPSFNSALSDAQSHQQLNDKFTLKVTLKECELIALEDPNRMDTLALVTHTTALILCNNLANSELLESQYEIQQFCLFWCLMQSEAETLTQLTNEANGTISICYERSPAGKCAQKEARQQQKGMEQILFKHRQIVHVQSGPLIVRGSLKDFFVTSRIVDAAYRAWERSQQLDFFWTHSDAPTTLFPTETSNAVKMHPLAETITRKCIFNAENLCIWLLKEATDTGQTMAPFLRLNVKDLTLHQTLSKTKVKCGVSMDSYREKAPLGWEPLLEDLRISQLDICFIEPNAWNLQLKPAETSRMELNITQTFLETLVDFTPEIDAFCAMFNAPAEALEQCRRELVGSSQSAAVSQSSSMASEMARISFALPADHLRPSTSSDLRIRRMDPKQITHPGTNIDIQLELEPGVGISLIGNDEHGHQEELVYALFSCVRANIKKSKAIYQVGCCINSIQIDNQLFGADRPNFFFCDPSALKDEPIAGPMPAMNFEMSYTTSEYWDSYDSFRLKFCNSCIFLDEQLLWRLVNFGICIYDRSNNKTGQPEKKQSAETKNCYFGTFQLQCGDISLSVLTTDRNHLPPQIRRLKEVYSENLMLFSFENALVTLTPFWVHRCYTTLGNLFANVGDFFIQDLKKQKLNIVVAMDAFGNPISFVNELKEGVQGLLFEGDVAGFTFGLSYGATNSISKFASSMARGVGSWTFDEQHEKFRRRMLRSKPEDANALTHFYGGLKGFGVGVFGGLTAIVKNTYTATREDGILPGVIRGVGTGAIDTLTKPLQGTFDLVEGTASALKEVVGAPIVRRAHFPKNRLRLPRVCSSLSGLLPTFSNELAEAQQELLRITGNYALNDENRLLCVLPFLDRPNVEGLRVVQICLISPTQCYITRQVDEQPSMVIYRILFQLLRKVQIAQPPQVAKQGNATRMTAIEVFYYPDHKSKQASSSSASTPSSTTPALTLWCSDRETAQRLCKQIMKAKAQFERHTAGKMPSSTAKKSSPIFTI